MTLSGHTLDHYSPIIRAAAAAEIRELARRLVGDRLPMVNSTAVGGGRGVAELLNRLIPLLKDLGIPTRWEVIRGGQEFFGVTKAIYNALQGTPVTPTTAMRNLFLEEAAENAASLDLDADLVVIHDPQPLPLGAPRRWRRGPGWVTPALERAHLAHGSGDRP